MINLYLLFFTCLIDFGHGLEALEKYVDLKQLQSPKDNDHSHSSSRAVAPVIVATQINLLFFSSKNVCLFRKSKRKQKSHCYSSQWLSQLVESISNIFTFSGKNSNCITCLRNAVLGYEGIIVMLRLHLI